MALFVLGDPHLSLGASKPMDIFPGWNDYTPVFLIVKVEGSV